MENNSKPISKVTLYVICGTVVTVAMVTIKVVATTINTVVAVLLEVN